VWLPGKGHTNTGLSVLGFSNVVRTGETVTSPTPDLRDALTDAAATARATKDGVWAADATTSGATITTLADLTNTIVIVPKLFRRLAEYIALGAGNVSLAGFKAFLASHDDRLYVIPDGHATGFDTIVDVEGQTVKLTSDITDLIFVEG
jgi:hypothetical protein